MSFLIAQILGLLALAAVCGGAFMYWAVRRQFTDVTHEYDRYQRTAGELETLQTLRTDAEARIAALEADKAQLERRLADAKALQDKTDERLEAVQKAVAGFRAADLTPVLTGLDAVQKTLAASEPPDLSPVQSSLSSLRTAVAAIAPADTESVREDVASLDRSLAGRLTSIEERLGALKNTDVSGLEKRLAALKNTDVSGIEKRLSALQNTDLSGIEKRLATLKNADLSGIEKRLATLSNTDVSGIEKRLATLKTTDVSGIEKRLATLKNTDVSGIEKRLATLKNTDLTPVTDKLEKVERAVAKLEAKIDSRPKTERVPSTTTRKRSKPPTTSKAARKTRRSAPRRKPAGALLKSAVYGKPDDLNQISGVGPKLEKMLNDIGVYYFFQVQDWKDSDVKRIDDMLQAFKGRIARDGWVRQARSLSKQPGAARPT
ncbi:MAG: hypothetical protein OEN56_01735 [Gemmatimonadota bacterium]|nr:hypothetical protein [Gemmatimonadota bacterium]